MRVEHGLGGAAAREGAVVAPVGVVAVHPALELSVEVAESLEALAVERRAVELLEGTALEALAHRIVIRGPGRDAVMDELEVGYVVLEDPPRELGAVEFLTVVKAPLPVHALDGTSEVSERVATPFLARSSRRVMLCAFEIERRAARTSEGIW